MALTSSDPENINLIQDSFFEAHVELIQTRKLTLEQAGCRQANLMEDIVIRLSANFQHHPNMVNTEPSEDSEPKIAIGTGEILQ